MPYSSEILSRIYRFSSANCVILSLGASFSRDLYNKFLHPEVEDLNELPLSKTISQIAVFLGSLVGILFAFYMTDILDAMIIRINLL